MSRIESFRRFGVDYAISWMPQWDCNLRCEYCGEINIHKGLMKGTQGGSLNGEFREEPAPVHWSEWVRAFNELPGRALIDISGGEPFLFRHLVDVLEELDDRHLVCLTTNLTLSIDGFLDRIDPGKILTVTGSLHLDNPKWGFKTEWRTRFFQRLLDLKRKGFTVQANFVAYPKQLDMIPLLVEVFNGRPKRKATAWTRGQGLPPAQEWARGTGGRDRHADWGQYYWHRFSEESMGGWSGASSPSDGTLYKDGVEIPFAKVPEETIGPAGKIYGGAAIINQAAYDRSAVYAIDYPVGELDVDGWTRHCEEAGWSDEMIAFNNETRGFVRLGIEPYSGGAGVPFEGYTDEEIELIDRNSAEIGIDISSLARKEIRETELPVAKARPRQKLCNAGQHRMLIVPNGNVYPCNMISMKWREECMGNFLEIFRPPSERLLCGLPCTCGGDRENVVFEYVD